MAEKYPNCGQLKKSLTDLYLYRIKEMSKKPDDGEQIISILVSIMIKNPTTIQHCVVILGRILEFYKDEPKQVSVLISKILKKYSKLPNTDLVEIWLQRFTVLLNSDEQFSYQSNLCQFVNGNSDVSFWNSEWLKKEYRTADKWYIDKSEKENLSFITSEEEIFTFANTSSDEEVFDL